eukprot:12056982-Karenia_brevis.AAC.1
MMYLPDLATLFDHIKKGITLELNLEKTVLIPLVWPLDDSAIFTIRNFIRKRVPSFINITIADKGELLGFWIGPRA